MPGAGGAVCVRIHRQLRNAPRQSCTHHQQLLVSHLVANTTASLPHHTHTHSLTHSLTNRLFLPPLLTTTTDPTPPLAEHCCRYLVAPSSLASVRTSSRGWVVRGMRDVMSHVRAMHDVWDAVVVIGVACAQEGPWSSRFSVAGKAAQFNSPWRSGTGCEWRLCHESYSCDRVCMSDPLCCAVGRVHDRLHVGAMDAAIAIFWSGQVGMFVARRTHLAALPTDEHEKRTSPYTYAAPCPHPHATTRSGAISVPASIFSGWSALSIVPVLSGSLGGILVRVLHPRGAPFLPDRQSKCLYE